MLLDQGLDELDDEVLLALGERGDLIEHALGLADGARAASGSRLCFAEQDLYANAEDLGELGEDVGARHELAGLDVFDIEPVRGTLTVRQGKGRRDRTVPIGERALEWVARYLDEARPALVAPPEIPTLFLSERGEPLELTYLANHMRMYVEGAKLGKRGACHIFRHSMATLMLEGGADIRHIQEILGHVETSTTAIYTRVSIRHLKQVHDATHPGAKSAKRASGAKAAASARAAPHELARGVPSKDELLCSLAAEDDAGDETKELAS